MSRCNGLHVLVVDDEEIIADTLALILGQHGFNATPVYSGETAMALARSTRPDLLISDVRMNGMSGIELAIEVNRALPNCRIVLISGSDQETIDGLLEDAGDDGRNLEILRKPLRPDDLLAHIDHVVQVTL